VVADSGAFSDAEGSMGSVSPKMDEGPITDDIPVDDEEDMTSIMSPEQRKALQKAAKTEKESATLERDTAKPPPSDEHPVPVIPRAAPVPAEARVSSEEPRVETPPKRAEPAAQAQASSAEANPGLATWELVAFVLLAAAIFAALRT
jgi:hypothetical protein